MKLKNQLLHYKIFLLAFLLLILWIPKIFAETPQLPYPLVGPGLEYRHERIGDVPWSIHILKVDRSRSDLKLITTLAKDTIFGLAQLSAQLASISPGLGVPAAAINGDFYILGEGSYQGDPTGIQVVNGEWVSAPVGTSVIIDKKGDLHLESVTSMLRVLWQNGKETDVGLNKQRRDQDIVLYTPRLGNSTRTEGGRELVLQAGGTSWLPLRVGQRYIVRVAEINDKGNTILRPNIMVISIGNKMLDKVGKVQVGDRLEIIAETKPILKDIENAIGGGPILIQKGKFGKWNQDVVRHPRTAIGWNKTHLFMVVVDGRQPFLSLGMTIPELAELMKRLGCIDAVNLDGGGSSTFWLGGKILNSGSDGRERGIANALVLVRKTN